MWVLPAAFSQIDIENKEQAAQLNDLKSFEFHQKESPCEVGTAESLVGENSSIKKQPSTLQAAKEQEEYFEGVPGISNTPFFTGSRV